MKTERLIENAARDAGQSKVSRIIDLATKHNCTPSVVIGWLLGKNWPHKIQLSVREQRGLVRFAKIIGQDRFHNVLFNMWSGATVKPIAGLARLNEEAR